VQAIVLVEDLETAAGRLAQVGLRSVPGGRHPGRGTANVIVAFGRQYLELLSVVDTAEAQASVDGRPVLAALARRGPGLARWSVEPDDIAAVGRRLDLAVEDRERVRPDGTVVRWRAVGVNEAWAEPWRCAFMAWDDPSLHPGRGDVGHRCRATGFAVLEVNVPDDPSMRTWLGGGPPPAVVTRPAEPTGPVRVVVQAPGGDIDIGQQLAPR